MLQYIKKYISSCIVVVFIGLFMYFLFFSKGIYIGQDYNGYIGVKSYFENLFVWNSDSFVFNHISLLIKHFPTFFWNYFFGFSIEISSFLFFFTLYLIAYFFLIKFLGLFSLTDYYKNLLAVWYLFSLYTFIKFSDGHFDFSQFYMFLPASLYFLYSFISSRRASSLMGGVISIVILQNIFISPYLTFIEGIIFLSIFFYLLFNKRRLLINFLIFSVILLLPSMVFINEYLIYSKSLNGIIVGDTGTKPLEFIQKFASTFTSLWKSFIGLGYWAVQEGYWPAGYKGSYYFPELYFFSNNILYIFFRFLLIFIPIFIVIFRRNKIWLYGLYVFLFSVSIQVLYFFLIKTGNGHIVEIILKFIPFFREPVGKIEGLLYIAIMIMFIGVLGSEKIKKNLKYILVCMLFVDFMLNIYLYLTTFNARYSTAYLESNVYKYHESVGNILEKMRLDVGKFIVLSSNQDSASIKQEKSVYAGVDPLISTIPYEYFYKVGGVPYNFNVYNTTSDLKQLLLSRGINLIIIRKNSPYFDDILGKNNKGENNYDLRIKKFGRDYKEYLVYDDVLLSILYFPRTIGKIGYTDQLSYTQINSTNYLLYVLRLKDKEQLNFIQNFNKNWKLYLEPYSQKSCKNPQIYTGESLNLGSGDNQTGFAYHVTECRGEKKNNFIDGIKKLREQPVFDETHHLVNGYANGRTLDADYIKQNFPKEYYKENPDGSIDVNLTLYFKPQSYFYLGLGVSGLTFLGLIAWLIIEWRREKKALSKKTDEN